MQKIIIFIFIVFIPLSILAQERPVSNWDGEKLILDNGHVKRILEWDSESGSFITTSLRMSGIINSFVAEGSHEFHFLVDDSVVTGKTGWDIVSYRSTEDSFQGRGARITLNGREGKIKDIELKLTYLLYPELPVIRKKIEIKNIGRDELKIESLDVENIRFPYRDTYCWVMHNYARYKHLGPYVGDWHDPVVTVHHVTGKQGIVLGNEAPGVTKRTSVWQDGRQGSLTIGLTHKGQDYPFRKWLKAGEKWESPYVFIVLYHGTSDPYECLNTTVNKFARKHMGIRINKVDYLPSFVYNTWYPHKTNINDTLIYELANAAAECGAKEFIIDDGWQTNNTDAQRQFGDWKIDRDKFPDGLKPVFDSIKALGMKPGMWISIAGASTDSKVYQEHSEWFIRYKDGSIANLHNISGPDGMKTACMGTEWMDYIQSVIMRYVKDHGLEYVKMDFAVVTSAYRYDRSYSGCYAFNHSYHKDREESLLNLYRRTWQLFDTLHAMAPDLFIDCTFETMGALQLIDYDMCNHAEGNWLSNFTSEVPLGSLRVRQMAWWRTPAIPAASMVIGNQQLDDPDVELSIMSLAGTFPIVLGDPRKISPEKRARIKSWSQWFERMQEKHDYMLYRQDLHGFGEPQEGCWDGFQRINTDSGSGGIVGVFRQGAEENNRKIFVKYLPEDKKYNVFKGPDSEWIVTLSGEELAETGFEVSFNKKYGGALFEIVVLDSQL